MKNTLLLLMAIALCMKGFAQEKNIDSLLQKAFNAVKDRDTSAYLKLFPDYNQFRILYAEVAQKVKDSSQKVAAMKDLESVTQEMFEKMLLPAIIEDFSKFIKRANEKKMDFSKLKLVKSDYYEEDRGEWAQDDKNLRGTMTVNDGTTEYEILFSDVLWSESGKGWFGISLNSIHKQGEIEKIPEEINIGTIQQEGIKDEMPPPPPPPIKKKTETKTKTPVKKTKTKS